MDILHDEDLGLRLGGETVSLGALCREIGEIEHAYIESFKSFRQDFSYRNGDPRLEHSGAALKTWFAELDRDLIAARCTGHRGRSSGCQSALRRETIPTVGRDGAMHSLEDHDDWTTCRFA